MAGCGYVCPQCEGLGFTDTGEPCDFCQQYSNPQPQENPTDNPQNGEENPTC